MVLIWFWNIECESVGIEIEMWHQKSFAPIGDTERRSRVLSAVQRAGKMFNKIPIKRVMYSTVQPCKYGIFSGDLTTWIERAILCQIHMLVFCFQNCSDLLRKAGQVIENFFWKSRLKVQNILRSLKPNSRKKVFFCTLINYLMNFINEKVGNQKN